MPLPIDIKPGTVLPLPQLPGLVQQCHVFEERSIWALNAALAANRPLLIRGEPGVGKSQLARAAAAVMNRPLLYEVVTARTECTDLLWRFDAVARLAEAQVHAARTAELDADGKGAAASARKAAGKVATIDRLDERRYLEPGPIWWSLNWKKALNHVNIFRKVNPPSSPDGWEPGQGCVLLIDEIDKADSDVPNGLLEALGNDSIHVPYLSERIAHDGGDPPLVILTTNEERDLPAAFLRRCLVLTLQLVTDST